MFMVVLSTATLQQPVRLEYRMEGIRWRETRSVALRKTDSAVLRAYDSDCSRSYRRKEGI
jgi:hypothetical protein